MQAIGTLITTVYTQAQQFILPALLVADIAIGGYHYMTGNHKSAQAWLIGGLIGAAIVISAASIAALVTGAVHA